MAGRHRKKRKELKEVAARSALRAVHVDACRILPDRLALLDVMPRGGIVAEVGVAFGDFSTEILRRTAPGKLHLIDAWSAKRYVDGVTQIREKFAGEISRGDIEVHQGLSTERLPDFADGYFDWVYIDTNHEYGTTIQELSIAAQKVRRNGLIAGHDFSVGNVWKPIAYGVIQACAQFCVEQGWRYKYLTLEPGGAFSFCLERIPD